MDPQLGEYFEIMRRESLLDLDNRVGKAQGGYCIEYPVAKRPFIFTNAVGLHDDVITLLHEGGHAFHVFESNHLPYHQQHYVPIEFAEVASNGMELLATPYLSVDEGGFYTQVDAARAVVELLETDLLFWPYMAVVDAFQHWVYENPNAALEPSNCDEQWAELWGRFMPGVDWSGLEQEMVTGWQRKGHIHQDPFYYIEYGLALLGAVQVWRNAQSDQAATVAAYRKALSLGGTAPLPQLFAAAGADFAFDPGTLSHAVELMEETITTLESVQGL
jgi:oligoendopeptidase F